MPRSECLSNIKLIYCNLTYVLHDRTEQVFSHSPPLSWITDCLAADTSDYIQYCAWLKSLGTNRHVKEVFLLLTQTHLKPVLTLTLPRSAPQVCTCHTRRAGVCRARRVGASWNRVLWKKEKAVVLLSYPAEVVDFNIRIVTQGHFIKRDI